MNAHAFSVTCPAASTGSVDGYPPVAITRYQAPEVGVALNKNQMASKRWLADALFEAGGSQLGRVLILGGWVGALGAVLLHDRLERLHRHTLWSSRTADV